MTDADKGINPLNFESDLADIRIRIRNPDHLVGRGNRSSRGQVKYILQFLYRVFLKHPIVYVALSSECPSVCSSVTRWY